MSEELDLMELEGLGLNFPEQKEKSGIFSFLNKVLKTKDTTKVGNLDEEELRVVRLLRDASNFAFVFDQTDIADYFKNEAEIILGTSDSKHGFLVSTAVTQKKQLETKSRTKQKEGGFKWFKKKEEQPVEEA